MSNEEVMVWLLSSITEAELDSYLYTKGNDWLTEANLLIL